MERTPTPAVIDVEVTEANLNHSHLYLRRHLAFFPSDAIGSPAKRDGEGKILTVHFRGVAEPVLTDIAGGNKLFLRARAPWSEFFRRHRIRPGDRVRIERLGAYEYRVLPPRRVAGVR